MLARHYRNWSLWPESVKARVEIVLVDDASPSGAAADVPRPVGIPSLSIYRVLVDKPWHQHAARNLAAKVAAGRWLVMTDMDHSISQRAASRMLQKIDRGEVSDGSIYTLHRVDALTGLATRGRRWRKKPHPNSFFLTRQTYWHIGGYDEDLVGLYGTDIAFRRRAFARAQRGHLDDVVLRRYSQWLFRDAATTTLARKQGRDRSIVEQRIAEKLLLGVDHPVPVLTFEWSRVV
jgi:hypothetical protein